MKKTNLSWVGALLVFALLLWCTAATPGKIDDPSTYTCAVYSSALSLLPPVVAIVLALNTKEVYTSLLVGIATGALLYANGNLELALTTLFFNEDGGMVSKLSDSSNVGILVFLVMLGILVALMNKAGGSAAFGRWASTHIHTRAGAQFAALLLGILAVWGAAILCQLTGLYVPNAELGMASVLPDFSAGLAVPSLAPTFMQMDFTGLFTLNFLTVELSFLFVDVFDT